MSHNLVPRGCYAYNEWETSFKDDDGIVHTEKCVEYYRNGEPFGVLAYIFVNEEFVSEEFVQYDPAL